MSHLVFFGLEALCLGLMVWVMAKTATDADQGIGWIVVLSLVGAMLFDGYASIKWLMS